jgi:two-component system sensor histidine kinase KdpD
MMFGTYFVVTLAMGNLIGRIRAKERMDRRREEGATAKYLLTLQLGDASTWKEIERAAVENVEREFKADAALLLPDASGQLRADLPDKELGAAMWAFEHGQATGRFTDTLPMAEAMYLPLGTAENALGVMRLRWRQNSQPTLEQRGMLDAFQRHIALVIDRQRLRDAEASARVLAESERLSHALLDSVSSELRAPVAAIQTAASELQKGGDPHAQRALAGEIEQATERLNRVVANLLDMTRLESGRVKPRLELCDVSDLIHAAMESVEKDLSNHHLKVELPPELPPVRADFQLLEQSLVNILLNAAVHTPPGTSIEVGASVEAETLAITVADRGPGLPPDALPRIFDKFYRAPGSSPGGTGLGLSIVKGFVEAQGGCVQAANRPAGGAMFTLRIPIAAGSAGPRV